VGNQAERALTGRIGDFYHPEVNVTDTVTSRLANSGVRVTGARREVLRAIASIEGPFTIEELAAALPEVGRATVYRTVKLLQESDFVCRMVLEDGGIRYELSQGDHHHHLICSQCGRVSEFVDPGLDAIIQANADRRGFDLAGHSVELYGLCAGCR